MAEHGIIGNKIRLKKASFKSKWEAVKFIEGGGVLYRSNGELLDIYSVVCYDPEILCVVKNKPSWQDVCIENGYPCLFSNDCDRNSAISILTAHNKETNKPYHSQYDYWTDCRPITNLEIYNPSLE